MTQHDLLYVGVQGKVVAFEKATGQELWATRLKSSLFVNLILDGDKLFAHTSGELFALDALTGALLWQDGLKGYGYELASLVTAGSNSSQAMLAEHLAERARQSASSAAASPSH